MRIHDIRHRVITDVPHVLDDGGPGQHTILVPQEKFEQRVLLVRQRDFIAAPAHPVSRRIQLQVGGRQPGLQLRPATSQQGPRSREEFCEGKRFRQIVIGAHVQTGDLVLHRIAGGQQQDRRRHAGIA